MPASFRARGWQPHSAVHVRLVVQQLNTARGQTPTHTPRSPQACLARQDSAQEVRDTWQAYCPAPAQALQQVRLADPEPATCALTASRALGHTCTSELGVCSLMKAGSMSQRCHKLLGRDLAAATARLGLPLQVLRLAFCRELNSLCALRGNAWITASAKPNS